MLIKLNISKNSSKEWIQFVKENPGLHNVELGNRTTHPAAHIAYHWIPVKGDIAKKWANKCSGIGGDWIEFPAQHFTTVTPLDIIKERLNV